VKSDIDHVIGDAPRPGDGILANIIPASNIKCGAFMDGLTGQNVGSVQIRVVDAGLFCASGFFCAALSPFFATCSPALAVKWRDSFYRGAGFVNKDVFERRLV
jgi:hypothetical protein